MRILIITSSYPETPNDSVNAGVFVRAFALALKREGHEVHILTPRKGFNNYDDEIETTYFWWMGREKVLTALNLKNPIDLIKAFSLFISGIIHGIALCLKKRYDHILAMWAVPSGFIGYILYIFTYIPYSVWVLGSDMWTFSRSKFGRMILKITLRNASHCFADGYTLCEDVKNLIERECIFLPSSRLLPQPKPVPLQKDKKNFLFIGRFHPNKGVDLLLEAISNLPETVRRNAHFHIFGDGPMRNKVEEFIRTNHSIKECVSLYGYADPLTVSSYLSACDVLIIPSRMESIPVILSDAAQMGTPVLVTNVGDMGEIVKKYRCGMVVECSSYGIRDGISAFMERDRKEFEEGLSKLFNDFKIENVASRFISIISSC